VRPVNPRSRKVKAYFPGYVFGRVDLEQSGRPILDWIPGAIGIINFGGDPAPVPDHLVNTLQHHLEIINASHKKISNPYQPGDVVAIQGGPFSGYEAIFDIHLPGRDRAEVLLKMMQGYQIRVELPIELIISKNTSSSLQPSGLETRPLF
jgi:transcriptional antiterminator RfaH